MHRKRGPCKIKEVQSNTVIINEEGILDTVKIDDLIQA